ncbi:LytTR family two component transcriptional regulator [Pseudoxanthomonas sp. 3HH-4]|uniref:LytR/AlgR family response regulator transcription factor n=1 Tax=Pseudoxanthomonas sp. 3HH-4 TaxID=1690214 RepID=UPI00114DD7C5|nr:LytTR family DNA-binding domain-containing protein [Pseudoxanthomonas sp. 3HH-4]TQM16825.1 LytTR family two component transcriptional regulator [Pseudoxanthomonas sp. 3HH-4]
MIRVCVVDDEPLARRGVLSLLAAFDDLQVVGEYEDGTTALAGLQAQPPDLVFMDVQMPGMTGLDVLAALPSQQRPLAILLTAHDSFAVRAFALNVVDYLLKPVDDARFAEALTRARQLLRLRYLDTARTPPAATLARHLEKFSVRIGHRTLFIRADSVAWIGADGDYAVLHVGERTYIVRESLHQLAAQLDPERFVRVHRSSIVRLDQVGELQPLTNRDAVLRLHDGTPVRVSRTYIDALLSALHAGG